MLYACFGASLIQPYSLPMALNISLMSGGAGLGSARAVTASGVCANQRGRGCHWRVPRPPEAILRAIGCAGLKRRGGIGYGDGRARQRDSLGAMRALSYCVFAFSWSTPSWGGESSFLRSWIGAVEQQKALRAPLSSAGRYMPGRASR